MNGSRRWIVGGVAVSILLAVSARLGATPPGAPLTILHPRPLQVVQRRDIDGGVIPVEVVGMPPPGGQIEARVAVDRASGWLTLEPAPRLPGQEERSTGALEAPAGGWYRLEVRSVVAGHTVGEAAVARVGVGEVFVVAGQSNSANHGEERLLPTDDRVVTLDPDGNWRPAADPQPGASGDGGSFLPALGDLLVERFGVPVGFVACGIGATSIREWLPAGSRFPTPPTLTGRVRPVGDGGWESDGEAFAMLLRRMRQCGAGGYRALLWHQGESDANQADPSRTLPGQLYEDYLGRLISSSNRAEARDIPWFVARASYHVPGDESSTDIRAAQAAVCRDGLALPGPDTDRLTGALRDSGGRGVHMSGAGQRRHAAVWFDAVAPWLEARLKRP